MTSAPLEPLEHIGELLVVSGVLATAAVMVVSGAEVLEWVRETHGEAAAFAIAWGLSLLVVGIGFGLIAVAEYRGETA